MTNAITSICRLYVHNLSYNSFENSINFVDSGNSNESTLVEEIRVRKGEQRNKRNH